MDFGAFSGVSATTISPFLAGKRKLRPALDVRLVGGLERAFVRNGLRLGAAFFSRDGDKRTRWPPVDDGATAG